MGVRGYRYGIKQTPVRRSGGVAFAAMAGVLTVMALISLEFVLVVIRLQRGFPLSDQAVDLGVVIVAGFLLIWNYWGVWELQSQAWQFHVFIGPLIILGLAGVMAMAPNVTAIIARDLKAEESALALNVIRVSAATLLFVELGTILTAILNREHFQIGRKKELWERYSS
jgi:apolipoprotein N-acyltransferase